MENKKKLKDLAITIVKKMNKKPVFVKNILKVSGNKQQIILEKKNIKGQKSKEFFYEENERPETFKGDVRVKKIRLYKNCNYKISKDILKKTKSIEDFFKIFNKIYSLKKNQKLYY